MTVRPVLLALGVALAAAPAAGAAQHARAPVPPLYRELTFRPIGPAVTGGRVHDVEALPFDPATIYLAAATGGIWKSTNKGTTWRPVFDDQATSTFGDLAISRSHPSVLYAGTGEQNNRQSTSWGSGVYRSDDGGETWRHLGLTRTRHIGRVRVHPADPEIAWVAAQGDLWAPSEDRGVYRTGDGGRTWERTLFVDTLTGATDLAVDACDPDLLYAATYQRLRRTWGFDGGGPGSGIWKSIDGGRTWERLSAGLPAGDLGRIGLAAAGNRCGTANAIVEHATEQGVYRTEDAGGTWARMSGRNVRPMYYSHIVIDPTDADRVYTLATTSARSEDGGRTWIDVSGRRTYDVGVHSDHHAMWIDPLNPDHYYLAGDAGLYETWDRGETYIRVNNVPIAQAYALGLDTRDPYNVYLGLQDNHSWMGPSATRRWAGILGDDWRQIGFGDGMYHQTDPSDPRVVFGNSQNGGYVRVDTETGDRLVI
ncbi:MAG: glycosyl hydrolase, partial [Gemmatimonadota bacterium]